MSYLIFLNLENMFVTLSMLRRIVSGVWLSPIGCARLFVCTISASCFYCVDKLMGEVEGS